MHVAETLFQDMRRRAHPPPVSRFRVGGAPHVGVRHRREHRESLARLRRPPATAALRGSGRLVVLNETTPRVGLVERVVSQFPRLARPEPRVFQVERGAPIGFNLADDISRPEQDHRRRGVAGISLDDGACVPSLGGTSTPRGARRHACRRAARYDLAMSRYFGGDPGGSAVARYPRWPTRDRRCGRPAGDYLAMDKTDVIEPIRRCGRRPTRTACTIGASAETWSWSDVWPLARASDRLEGNRGQQGSDAELHG